MSFPRIKAILAQEYYITRKSVEVFNDVFFYPLWTVIVFGFLTLYLLGRVASTVNEYMLLGILLWEIISVMQYSVSVGTLWNLWSRNLTNMFISPISISEYLTAYAISGTIKALLVLFITSAISVIIFHFNILDIGIVNIIFFFLNLILFAFSLGIVILGMIFRFGTRIQAFAWGVLPVFQPLTAVVYPVSVLPKPLQAFALLLPPTHVFEAARYSLTHHEILWTPHFIAFGENVIYFILACWIFNKLFIKSKQTGQFVKNDG